MFKKIEDLSKPTLLSKSAIKDLRSGAIELFPAFEALNEDIMPKKVNLSSCRLRSEYKMDIIGTE
jgi:PUA domain protein